MATTKIGGTTFTDVAVPFIYVDWWVLLEEDSAGKALVTILRQTPDGPSTEILRNEPGDSDRVTVTKSIQGAVVGDRETGRFLYKLRVGHELSIIFGTVEGAEMKLLLRDEKFEVRKDDRLLYSVSRGSVTGSQVGVLIDAEGNLTIGTSLPRGY